MGGGGNVTVELMIDPVEGAAVPGFQIVFEFIQAPDQSVYFFVRTAQCGQSGIILFHQHTHLQNIFCVFFCDRDYLHTFTAAETDVSLFLQLKQCFPHRSTADSQFVADCFLRVDGSNTEAVVKDGILDKFIGLFFKCIRLDISSAQQRFIVHNY